MKHQSGLYAVEFAIVGSVFFLILFACIEIARALYTWNLLTEISRRGARLASVCHIDQANVQPLTGMVSSASLSSAGLLPNFSDANLQISYLTLTGAPATSFEQIRLVRAEIINYTHQFLIPGLSFSINSNNLSTTLPRESLGVTRFTFTTCT
ncbi:TadE/TadG family type IV pilus assembly protein [Paraferrimonas sedimenticola]|uniref:Pilus biosynthesis protein TadE n=1 Tax=Paraferrimonas sedimenticola TaxID=375674 RepID=A0AA37W036_9GAMM|nr:TadE family protein [Paraferrimonas sedimenticola]GLP94903.1 pilus biosynthesis protein TadE [Paraferrimonas sedimenticola]